MIAADGRMRKREGGKVEVVKDDVQKIYPIPGESLVYVLYGNMMLGKDEADSGPIVVDLASEVATAVASLVGQKFDDAVQYAESLSTPLLNRLTEASGKKQISRFPARSLDVEEGLPGHLIGYIFLFGYYNGKACEIDIRLFHRKHIPDKQVIPAELWIGYNPKTWGSLVVAKGLFESAPNPFFEAERKKLPKRSDNPNIEEGIAVAKAYISACDSDTGRGLDPDLCPGIGGKIQIAIIKPDSVTWA